MSLPKINWRRWRGWLVGGAIFLTGVGLIISDRVAARSPGDRPWIIQPSNQAKYLPSQAALDPVLGEPWPDSISRIVFPKIQFHGYGDNGSYFDDIVEWIERQAHVQIDINWPALASFGIDRKSNLYFDRDNVSLPQLLDALIEKAADKAQGKPKFAWETQSGRIIRISTARDPEVERECQVQRQKAAGPELRRALDRPIPYVKLRELSLAEALRYCQRVSGVRIVQQDVNLDYAEQIDVIARDITFEKLIDLILHRTNGKSHGAWHFKVEGEGLMVFRDEGEK